MNGIYSGVRLLVISVLLSGLASCGGEKTDGRVWKEEVRLMNGELIIADMKKRYAESGDISQSSGPLTYAEIRFEHGGKKYVWGERGLSPMALQQDPQGRFYIVSGIPYCWAWRERGRPDSYYVVSRYEGGRWVEVAISEVDPDAEFNLAGSSRAKHSSEWRDYVFEKDEKFKDRLSLSAYKRKILLGKGISDCH